MANNCEINYGKRNLGDGSCKSFMEHWMTGNLKIAEIKR